MKKLKIIINTGIVLIIGLILAGCASAEPVSMEQEIVTGPAIIEQEISPAVNPQAQPKVLVITMGAGVVFPTDGQPANIYVVPVGTRYPVSNNNSIIAVNGTGNVSRDFPSELKPLISLQLRTITTPLLEAESLNNIVDNKPTYSVWTGQGTYDILVIIGTNVYRKNSVNITSVITTFSLAAANKIN